MGVNTGKVSETLPLNINGVVFVRKLSLRFSFLWRKKNIVFKSFHLNSGLPSMGVPFRSNHCSELRNFNIR